MRHSLYPNKFLLLATFSLVGSLPAASASKDRSAQLTSVRIPSGDLFDFQVLERSVDKSRYPTLLEKFAACKNPEVKLVLLGSDLSTRFDPPLPALKGVSGSDAVQTPTEVPVVIREDHWGKLEIACATSQQSFPVYFELLEDHQNSRSLFVRPWDSDLGGGRLKVLAP